MRALILFFAILQIVHCSCPSGFDLVRGGECRGNYTRISVPGSDVVKTGISKCKEIQGQPIIIHNEEHQSDWCARSGVGGAAYTFIGLVCNTTTNHWEWADGSDVDFKPPKNSYDPALDNSCSTSYYWQLHSSDGYWYRTSGGTLTTNVFCTTQLQQPVPSDDGCDSFDDDSEDGMCYQIGATTGDWRDAQKICRNFGANLASVHNQKENSFIRRLAVSKAQVNGLYLGALSSGNRFGWIDGSNWDYQNFYPGFPINGLGDCLVMDTQGSTGNWMNVDCDTPVSVACMRPQNNYTTPGCPSEPPKEGEFIFSPGFPFDASTPCDYMLIVEEGKRVEVEILMLEANSCCDRLTIYENYFGGNVIANLTGEAEGQIYTTNSSNFMKVAWKPNGGVNVRGMMLTFRGV